MNNDTLEKVRKIAEACKNKVELLEMRRNCCSKNNLAAVDIVEKMLDRQYPNWEKSDALSTRRGGNVSTTARFRSRTQKFESQIEAYIWLINQFAASNPKMFTSNGKTDDGYLRLLLGHRKDFAMHFAPDATLLDKKNGKVNANDSRPVQLECGWWANTVLSGTQKLRLIERLAEHCDIQSGEWTWEPDEKTDGLQKRLIQTAHGQVILDEFAKKC